MVAGSQEAASTRTWVVAIGYLGFGAAHGARQRRGMLNVGNHEILRGQRPLDIVEGGEHLIVASGVNHDPPILDPIEVEGVGWLTEFHHHIIRNVHDIADRPNPCPGQPLLHPQG